MKINLAPWQLTAVENPYSHFAMFGGIATGKTYTGSHFAIKMIIEHPDATGFIGANDYNQLSQATLRELFWLLDKYRFDYVCDRIPPPEWGVAKKFKKYANVLSVRNPRNGKVTTIFTRVLSKANPLRGIEFSWYWIDETSYTPQDTHDVILSRMRENDWVKGLVTSTTNGEDWSKKRFVNGNTGDMLYGSMHIPTIMSVKAGIISQAFYDTLVKSYSPMMAAQELDAKHVNVRGGRAYYSASDANRRGAAPWGDRFPTRDRPLAVGMDFNFQPAPCVWVIGQKGPMGTKWERCIHWFRELAHTETGTPAMTIILLTQFPDFFYDIVGDASGNRGTTSNAGETDYNQVASTLSQYGALYTIDTDQNNPLVKNRVENMNAMFGNAAGEVRQTYDPSGCPLLDGDVKFVGWKQGARPGKGVLDNGGDLQRTHASDGAGYYVWKKFPPLRIGFVGRGHASSIRPQG